MKKKNIFFAVLFIFSSSVSSSVITMDHDPEESITEKEIKELKKKLKKASLMDCCANTAVNACLSGTGQGVACCLPSLLSLGCGLFCCCLIMDRTCSTKKSSFCNITVKEYLRRKFEIDPYCEGQVKDTLQAISDESLDLTQHIDHYMQEIEGLIQYPLVSKHLAKAKKHYQKVNPGFFSRWICACYSTNQEQNMFRCIESLIKARKASEPPPEITMALCAKHLKAQIPSDVLKEIKGWMDKLNDVTVD